MDTDSGNGNRTPAEPRFPAQDRFAAGAQYIGGRLRPGTSGRRHAVVDPATGETVYAYELAGPADVDAAVAAAKEAFPGWSGATPGERSAALHRLAGVLAERAEEFAQAESLQCGKPLKLSREFDVPGTDRQRRVLRGRRPAPGRQVGRGVLGRPHLLRTPRADRRRRVHRALELPAPDGRLEDPPGDRGGQHHRPQARRDHPADLAPVRRGRQGGRDSGRGRQHRHRGRERTPASTSSATRTSSMTSFTGSTGVGKRVAEIATRTVKRLHLELGGKAPFVVFDDADLEAAVHGAVAASLINSGQDCTAATRAYVQRPLYEAFVEQVAALMETVRDRRPVQRGHRPRPADLAHPPRPRRRLRRAGQGLRPDRHRRRGPQERRRLLPAHPHRGRPPGQRGRPGRDLRPGPGGAALRQRRRGHRAGQRHPLRPRRLRLEPRRVPHGPGHPRDQGGLRVDQRPHSDHQRDAARRLQGERVTERTCRRIPSRSTRRSSM